MKSVSSWLSSRDLRSSLSHRNGNGENRMLVELLVKGRTELVIIEQILPGTLQAWTINSNPRV